MTISIERIQDEVKTIAVVGASNKPGRASRGVMQFLQNRGYKCFPVNPRLAGTELLGEIVYADLASIPEAIDMVDIFRNSHDAAQSVDDAIAIQAKVVWMQLGVINESAAQSAREAGLTVVMDRCPAIDWR